MAIIFFFSGIYNIAANKAGDYCEKIAEKYADDPSN